MFLVSVSFKTSSLVLLGAILDAALRKSKGLTEGQWIGRKELGQSRCVLHDSCKYCTLVLCPSCGFFIHWLIPQVLNEPLELTFSVPWFVSEGLEKKDKTNILGF